MRYTMFTDHYGNLRGPWIWAIALGLVALLIFVSSQGGTSTGVSTTEALTLKFQQAPKQDINLPSFSLPNFGGLPKLPEGAGTALENLKDRVGSALPQGGSGTSGTYKTARLQIDITSATRTGDQVTVKGSLKNITSEKLDIPISMFSYRDSNGVAYSVGNSTTVPLGAGQSAPLDLGVPVPDDGRGLAMLVAFAPDETLEIPLLAKTPQE
jgi:hypothetical protein